jgi:cytochrome c556
VQGSKFFFKGGTATDFAARAGDFKAAAEQLALLADQGDKAGADAQAGQLLAGCAACHTPFRAQY